MGRLIRLDWAIKNILRKKANFAILEGFLSELFGMDVTIAEILESESNQVNAEGKYNRVDLLVKDKQGKRIIVEIQSESEFDFLHRLYWGVSKLVTESLKIGDPYHKVSKVFSVGIVFFDLGRGEDYLYRGHTSFHGVHLGDKLMLSKEQQELFKIENPEHIFAEYFLIKVPKFNNEIRNSFDEWIYFLRNEEIRDDFKAKGIQEAQAALEVLKLSKEEQAAYNTYLENLHYHASMADSSLGSGIWKGKREELFASIQNAEQELGLTVSSSERLDEQSTEALSTLRSHLMQRLRIAREQAEQAAEQAQHEAEQERSARELAEQATEQERNARKLAERTIEDERLARQRLEAELAELRKRLN